MKGKSLLRRVLTVLGAVLGTFVLLVIATIVTWVLSTNDTSLVVLGLLLIVIVVGTEVYFVRNVTVLGSNMTMKEWLAKDIEKNGEDDDDGEDEDEDTFEFEMATINPVMRMASGSAVKSRTDEEE